MGANPGPARMAATRGDPPGLGQVAAGETHQGCRLVLSGPAQAEGSRASTGSRHRSGRCGPWTCRAGLSSSPRPSLAPILGRPGPCVLCAPFSGCVRTAVSCLPHLGLLLKHILPLGARELPTSAMAVWGLWPCLSASACSCLSTWDSYSLAPHRSLSCSLSLRSSFRAILVAIAMLRRGPGGGGGAGSHTAAAASAISNARHLQGALAQPHFGGPWGLCRPLGLLLGRWGVGKGAGCGSESAVLGGCGFVAGRRVDER